MLSLLLVERSDALFSSDILSLFSFDDAVDRRRKKKETELSQMQQVFLPPSLTVADPDLELRGREGLLALPAFLHSVIFFTQNKVRALRIFG